MSARRVVTWLGGPAVAGVAWGWFEAGWVRLRTVACPVPGLPDGLAGLRIAHLSDFHLGLPSRGTRAVERGVRWAAQRGPDLVCLTGDLLSHPRGHERLTRLLAALPPSYAVLGNHDYGLARDPFARAAAPYGLPSETRLLRDESVTFELRGHRVQVLGVDPLTYLDERVDWSRRADEQADLRVLLCHYPRIVDRLEAGAFHLVLAGHLHDGQITIPYRRHGKVRLAHPRFPYPTGLYRRPAGTLHVSPGLGTTFVPFRFFARPEATELTLVPA
jgi:predicted MPP superfamily phosphohydrolase